MMYIWVVPTTAINSPWIPPMGLIHAGKICHMYTAASFNSSLYSRHLSVITVDALEFEPEINKVDREKAMEAREGFYQTQLKTLERYGGMNTLDSNHILFKTAGA